MICRIARFGTYTVQRASSIISITYVTYFVPPLPTRTRLPLDTLSFGLICGLNFRILAKPASSYGINCAFGVDFELPVGL
jgi:hypothetical protein